eukprot:g1080.t1
MPKLWTQSALQVQVAAANEAGQSKWTTLKIPLTGALAGIALSAPAPPVISPPGLGGSRPPGPAGGFTSAATMRNRTTALGENDVAAFDKELRKLKGHARLRAFLEPHKKNILQEWLRSVNWSSMGSKQETLATARGQPGPQGQEFPKGLLVIEGDAAQFVDRHMEPRHAVAVATVPKGSKRHDLLADLAEDEDLRHLLAIGVTFAKGRTSLMVQRYRYDRLRTKSAIFSWLQEAYVTDPTKNPFSILLVVKPVGTHGPELAKALEPHAARLSRRLKVSFFAKTPATQQLCDIYGVRTSDEFLLIEAPQELEVFVDQRHFMGNQTSPKYRVENVTAGDVDRFFYDYESGLLPRYLMSYKETEPQRLPLKMSNLEGLRELTGEDFIQAVQNPQASVLVEFVSENCEACKEFDAAYREVARKVQQRSLLRQRHPSMSQVIIARMDQSANEHTELIKGTPWLRFWQRLPHPLSADKKKRGVDVELRSVDTILDFLDEQEPVTLT